jgi:WD40 repeat protein
LLRTLQHLTRIFSLSASPDGKRLASGADHIRIWDAETGENLLTIDETEWVVTVSWSPDGERIAAGEILGALRLWQANDGALAMDLGRSSRRAWSLSWGRGGRLLATAGDGRVVTVFDTRTGKEAAAYSGSRYWGAGVACLTDGLLASGDAEGIVRFFRLPEAPEVPRAARPNYPPNESHLARMARQAHQAGQHEEALKHARGWRERSEWKWGSPEPECLAIEVLALEALKRGDEANRALARLRELMRNSGCRSDAEVNRLYRAALAKITLPALPAEEEALRQRIVSGTEAADRTKPDRSAFLARYLPGARHTDGRGPKPGPYDVTRDLAGLHFQVNCWYIPPGPMFRGTIEVDEVKIAGDSAAVRFRQVVRWPTGFSSSATSVRLTRTPSGWKIAEHRTWPVANRNSERRMVYSEAAYRTLDDKVEEARKGGDVRELRQALLDAHRPTEAHAVAKKVTGQADATAADWVVRATAALSAGDDADTIASALQARQLAPKADLPHQLVGALRQVK